MSDPQPTRVPGLPPGEWTSWPASTLAAQYNARATVADFDAEMQAYARASAPLYRLPNCQADVAYGPGPDETLDLFALPAAPTAPLFLFIHGGYWRALHSRDSVFMAQALNAQGLAVASLNYSLAPAATLPTIVDQCRRALRWIHQHGASRGITPSQVVVAGSSAGAHLAAMLLSADWQQHVALPAQWAQSGVLVSGLYDLAPLAHTTPNDWLQLDASTIAQCSPIAHLPAVTTRLRLVVAQHDTPAFQQQTWDYAQRCASHGLQPQCHTIAQRNHFNVILDWTDPRSLLSQVTMALLHA